MNERRKVGKPGLTFVIVLIVSATIGSSLFAGGDPLSSSSIMFQAFYWDCFNESGTGNWYNYIKDRAAALKTAGFTHFWFPVPCKGNSGAGGMGYDLFDNYDLGTYNQKGTIETAFGSLAELQAAAAATGNVLPDLVANHMMGAPAQCTDAWNGLSYWQNFYYPHGTFQKGCSDFHPGNPADSDGYPYLMGEDVAHMTTYMFNGQKDWASWMKTQIGNVSGFRLDAVKHFSWNMSKEFGTVGSCVGEYWDNKANILNWIGSTGNYAFDFPLYYTMKDSGAGALSGAGLYSSKKGVSFVANHDVDEITQKLRAYGYIMYIDSIPCVFWKDWYNTALQPAIQRAMTARKTYNFAGPFTVYNAAAFVIFENDGKVFGCFNSAAATGSGTITVGPNITYTAVAYSGSTKPADIKSSSTGALKLTAPAKGYTYWYGGTGGGTGKLKTNYTAVNIPGNCTELNNWDPAGANNGMTLVADWTWRGEIPFAAAKSIEYKFAMNKAWTINRGLDWGLTNTSGPVLPQENWDLEQDGHNILANLPAATCVWEYYENTETSKLYVNVDFDIDGDVDLDDFAIFANHWLNQCAGPNWCDGADLNKSGSVDWYDLVEFVEVWLLDTNQ